MIKQQDLGRRRTYIFHSYTASTYLTLTTGNYIAATVAYRLGDSARASLTSYLVSQVAVQHSVPDGSAKLSHRSIVTTYQTLTKSFRYPPPVARDRLCVPFVACLCET